ncbi:MAG TPA: isochorismatase family cysteine hydrolase [Longimicrobiales bacterium]
MKTALLLIDVINRFDWDGADALIGPALRMAERLTELRQAATDAGVPVVYVNDNFDDWARDFSSLVEDIVERDLPGRPIVEMLRPRVGDLYILKPRHSGFHATPLEILLRRLEVDRLVLTGLQTHICVLFTAHAAHMRNFEIVVPADCCAAERVEDHDSALRLLASGFDIDVRPAGENDPFAARLLRP